MHYHAPHWLPGAHLQTLWPLLLKRHLPLPDYHRERISTPDGDFVDLDWLEEQPNPAQAAPAPRASGTSPWAPSAPTGSNNLSVNPETALSATASSDALLKAARGAGTAGAGCPPMAAPLVILFHGLEGSSSSHYARALMHAVAVQGWRGVVMNFRGCSGTPNLLPRAYHSGDSAEIAWLLALLRQRNPHAPLFAVGVSLGGNALLKHLGEQAGRVCINAAAAVSVPYDLGIACDTLSRGFSRIYTRHFLSSLIPRTLAKARHHPHHPVLQQRDRILSARNLRQFDDLVTAPLHGFRDAHAYYTHSSCRQYLGAIDTPTLLLQACNDPFLPRRELPDIQALPSCVQLEIAAGGGHAGFVHGRLPGAINWLPQRLIQFFAQQIRRETVP